MLKTLTQKSAFIIFIEFLLYFFVLGCGRSSGELLPQLQPTIYYKPIVYKDKETCASSELKELVDVNDKVLITLCRKSYDNCLLQGSCYVVEGEKTRNFNFTVIKEGIHRFAERKEERCPYGYGVAALCLDPFYTVAADLSFHKVGEVIFVPRLVDLRLPDGTRHNGYFIIRDKGGAILGEDRFDFFTGFLGPYTAENVFAELGLGDKKRRFGYQKVGENIAKKIRDYRNYPNIP